MILSILDIKKVRKNYLYYSIFLIIFAIIYESFSHGVYSNYMIFAFLIPFIYGFLGSFLLKKKKNKLGNTLYNFGIVTLSVGSVIKGVLDIFGTTNWLVNIYLYTGIVLVVFGIIFYLKKTYE